jgi:hypothetical protein
MNWWPGEGNSTDVMNGNVGTSQGGVTFVQGRVGQAFNFDGTGQVVIPDHPDLDLQRFTLAVWIFPTLLNGEETELILNKEPETGFDQALTQYELGIKSKQPLGDDLIPYGHLTFYIGGLVGLPNDFSRWVDGGRAVPLNTWTHVALTFDGASATLYVDGVVSRRVSGLSGTIGASAAPLILGGRSPSELSNKAHDLFDGLIDELELYGRALSAEEVAVRFNAGSMPLCFPCDADANGALNADDARALVHHLRTNELLPGNGDCDKSGRVGIRDLIAIYKVLKTP